MVSRDAPWHRAAGALGEQRRPYREEVRQLLIEEVVGAVEAVRGAPAATWLTQHGAPGKWLVLRLARRLCGLRAVGVRATHYT